jgi:hypothetical protein
MQTLKPGEVGEEEDPEGEEQEGEAVSILREEDNTINETRLIRRIKPHNLNM